VQTCLAKDPDDRWQSARDLHRELEWITRWSNATTSLQSFNAGFFDVTRDGKRVVAAMAGLSAAGPLTHITFLLNFADELRRNTTAR
jgi:hypothetical protein